MVVPEETAAMVNGVTASVAGRVTIQRHTVSLSERQRERERERQRERKTRIAGETLATFRNVTWRHCSGYGGGAESDVNRSAAVHVSPDVSLGRRSLQHHVVAIVVGEPESCSRWR